MLTAALSAVLALPFVLSVGILSEVEQQLTQGSLAPKKTGARRVGRRLPGISPDMFYEDNELTPYNGYSQYFLKAAKAVPRLGRRWDVSPRDELIRELSDIANEDSSESEPMEDDMSFLMKDPEDELISKYFKAWLKRRREHQLEDELEM